jgi:8-oxo-dGTP pyrophosphatase MutT (NUDIX family)
MTGIRVVSLASLDLRFAPRPWPFAEQWRDEIEAYFQSLKRDKPDLWNGEVMLLRDWRCADGRLSGVFFTTDFASMLAWRDWDFPDDAVRNCFAQGALRAADGAFLLGVMGAHTANAGKIYFPSGTPDPDDVQGDTVDLDGSVLRELTEETGLTAQDVSLDAGWHAVLAGPRIGMMKIMRSREPADALRARILAHLSTEDLPELSDIRIVRGPDDLDPMMPPFVTAFLAEMWKK